METPAVGSDLLARQIIEAPTNLRSIAKNSGDSGLISEIMPLTVPGVVQVGNGAKWLTPGAGATGIKVKVDGIETTFGNFGSPDNVSQPSVEAVQEFTANVLTTRAEFGGMGTVTTATKSGANHFHGGLFWFVRNSATDARNTFSTTKPFQNLHNYGGTVSGRLQRDRTFFFFDFDGMRGAAAYLFSPNVPTVAMRRGDFTGIAALRIRSPEPLRTAATPFWRGISARRRSKCRVSSCRRRIRSAHANGGELSRVVRRA